MRLVGCGVEDIFREVFLVVGRRIWELRRRM
jgi:hypothetical protein